MRREMPAELVERVRGGATPVTARDAATVLLLRDGLSGLEVYLLRRVTGMAFAGGMYVYPGGGVDRRDSAADLAWAGPSAAAWAQRLGSDEDLARALVCAAVRETFEESGVLLAGPDEHTVVGDVSDDAWEVRRQQLESRELAFGALLEDSGLVLRTDLLRAWARWITPEAEPRRFDARFFVAALPEGQATRDISREADRVSWARPTDVLAAVERDEIGAMLPTRSTLESIAGHDSVEAVLAAAETQELSPVRPRVLADDDGAHVVLPGEAGYGS